MSSYDDLGWVAEKMIMEEKAIQNLASQLTPETFGSILDRTLLKTNASPKDFVELCKSVHQSGSYVCISSDVQAMVQEIIKETGLDKIRGVAVVGWEFPNGNLPTSVKVRGVEILYQGGATDVDGVVNHHLIPDWPAFRKELFALFIAAEAKHKLIGEAQTYKLIFEMGAFKKEEDKVKAIEVFVETVKSSKFDFHAMFKTGTGFWLDEHYRSARREDVRLAARIIGRYDPKTNNIGIKPAGGIKTAKQALEFMLDVGTADADGNLLVAPEHLPYAFRVGCSADLYADFIKTYKS